MLIAVSPEMVAALGKWSPPVQVMIIEATEENRIKGATHELIARTYIDQLFDTCTASAE